MGKRIEIKVGERFGKLVIVEEIEGELYLNGDYVITHRQVLCLCDCGKKTKVRLYNLRVNKNPTRSCGCLGKERAKINGKNNVTHNLRYHPLYNIWNDIMQRCYNKKRKPYYRYGGRGIDVYKPWHDIKNFIHYIEEHLGVRPEGYTLDRIDNDKGYYPSNVRWATHKQQANNRSK